MTAEEILYLLGLLLAILIGLFVAVGIVIAVIRSVGIYLGTSDGAAGSMPRGAPPWRVRLPDGEHRVWVRELPTPQYISIDDLWVPLEWHATMHHEPRHASFSVGGHPARFAMRTVSQLRSWRGVVLIPLTLLGGLYMGSSYDRRFFELTVDGGKVEPTGGSAVPV
jgi:hypothetical protein